MGLPNEHIPLPCSLREQILRAFPHQAPADGTAVLETDALVRLLAGGCEDGETPVMAIRRHGDGADGAAGADDAAVIEWVTLAFDRWESDFPVEAPLRESLRRLLPLATAVALRDAGFLTPGGHALHTLLDRLQQSAVGWQARLERAGQMLEQRIKRAVDRSLGWFTDGSVDFAAVASELQSSAERDEERAARMVHRLEETETAAMKTRLARREAARLINEGLAACELPGAVGDFLRGPWYDSLQLVAVRYGVDSQEWREIRRITGQLMDSVQRRPDSEPGTAGLRRLAGELRHWLLSLQHDADAADDAIGLIEYVHLRQSLGQDLGLTHIPPLPVPGEGSDDDGDDGSGEALATGQWFLLEDDDGPLRAKLGLQLEEGRHLLFTNAVGLKAIDLPRDAFLERLRQGRARRLPTEDSFSLSLAHAAGIDDEKKLRALIEPGYAPPPDPGDAETDAEADADDDAIEAEDAPPPTAPEDPDREPERAPPVAADRDDLEPDAPPRGRGTGSGSREEDEAELPSLELELAVEPLRGAGPARRREFAPAEKASILSPAASAPPPRSQRPAADPEIDVPMGAWLGFHDGETPIMAKLAVYDPRRDYYIFVNRRGIALRELSRSELLALIDEGMVDILETRSYFRDEVRRVRGRRDE